MYKKISFVCLGKLGLPLATNFAKNGHEVLAVDKNTRLIEILNAGKEPWLEVGLLDNIKQAKKNIASRNLSIFYEIIIESLLINWVLKHNSDSFFESSMQEKSPSMQPINF